MSDQISLMRRASFAGLEFPWNKISIKGSLRHHVHEYPHQPGGEIEGLGRKLYEFHFSCDFHDTFFGWSNLYPVQLGKLRRVFETEVTSDLFVPNFGTIKAKAISWDQNLVARVRSGETVEFTFLENTQNDFSIGFILGSSTAAMMPAVARLKATAAAQGIESSLFDDLVKAVADLIGLVQGGEIVAAIAASKVATILNICAAIDDLSIFNLASSYPTANLNREVWASANQINVDLLRKQQPLASYFVDHLMSIIEVAQAIFNDTIHAIEILQLNSLDDAMAIPAGTIIQHYALPSLVGG